MTVSAHNHTAKHREAQSEVIDVTTSLPTGLLVPGLSAAINTAWAIVIWQYTGVENIQFPSLTVTTDGKLECYSCELRVEEDLGVRDLQQNMQNMTLPLREIPCSPPVSDDSPLLSTITTFRLKAGVNSVLVNNAGPLIELVTIVSDQAVKIALSFSIEAIPQEVSLYYSSNEN